MSIGTQLRWFLLVGGFCTLLQYGILIILVQASGLSPAVASSIGFAVSALASYWLNHRLTFASHVGYGVGLARFATVAGCGLLMTAALMTVGVDWLGLNYIFAQVCTTGLVLAWNFIVNRWWTFEAATPRSGSEA